MSIITWIENGKKQFGLFDSKYFENLAPDFPVFESHRRSLRDVVAFTEEEVVLVSGDRKRYRMISPSETSSSDSQGSPQRGENRKIA